MSGGEPSPRAAWDEAQDDALREASYLGAEAARDRIWERCRVWHSVDAVRMRASRIHCSLAVRTVCPSCGAVGVTLIRSTGMCRLCTERYHLEQEREFNRLLEEERAHAEDSNEVLQARRERDAIRQRNSRTCRKYGLKSRRERGH